jgi:uncharacterized OsmC-like protein
MDNAKPAEKRYNITVSRESPAVAKITTHGVSLVVSMNGNDPALGFTAPETVLAGYGACLMTNLGKAAQALGVRVDDARIEFNAVKRTEPLGFRNVQCKITIKSAASEDTVRKVFEQATSDGTATNAVHEGFRAAFELSRE